MTCSGVAFFAVFYNVAMVANGQPVFHLPTTFDGLEPMFPMTHSFNTGVQYQNEANGVVMGHLNVPLVNWGVWDLHGEIFPQTSNPTLEYGHVMNPINTLNLSPQEIERLHNSEQARELKRRNKLTPVNALPGSGDWIGYGAEPWYPLRCRPPTCNPYVHSFSNGLQYEQGNDVQVPFKLDFPLPAFDRFSPSYRFPLSGNPLTFGDQPVAVNYGHVASGIDPRGPFFGFTPLSKNNVGNPSILKAILNPQPNVNVDAVEPPVTLANIFSED